MKGSVKLPVFIDDARKLVNTTQLRAKYLGATYEAEYCQWQTLHGLGSLMETASLIITPNAYLEGKLLASYPPDPIGDFDVTRATTATRVNSAGLVELVPYNLFKYSEQFDDVNWDKSSGAITANATTAPNGTTTADLYTANGSLSNHDFFQGFTGYAKTTSSIYVKKNTAQFVYISLNYQSSGVNWATGIYDLDNLTTVTFQSGGVTNQVASISDEGNGWRRITLTIDTADTALFCMYGVSDSMSPTLGSRGRVENSSSASFYAWGAQLNEGTIKDYQKTETRLNIPRLDYSNGTCPSLLVEPQRTNIITYSEDFSNAIWFKEANGSGSTPSVTANYATASSGNNTADRIQMTNVGGSGSASNYSLVGQYPLSISSTGTATIYLKSNTSSNQNVLMYWGAGQGQVFVVTPQWQRFTLSNLSVSALSSIAFGTRGGSGSFFNGGDEVLDILAWGAQLEAGSYATSYIPTTSASVTRNADVISKTGISSLIGQTEGVIFYDFILSTTGVDFTLGNLYSSSNANSYSLFYINPSNQVGVSLTNNGVTQCEFVVPTLSLGRHRIAFAYKANDFAVYVDGVQIGTDTSGSVPNMDEFNLSDFNLAPSAYRQEVNIYAAALWKTRKTNTQLAQLTTI